MGHIKLLIVLIAGIIAGFINVNAGGGSLITMPALIFMGLPSAVANGTNRIAILFGAISSTTTFKRRGIFDWKLGLELGIPALLGALIGSSIVINVPDKVFNALLSGVMIMVLLVIIINPAGKIKKTFVDLSTKKRIAAGIAFFFVGIYGGFIQAGVGFLIIASLSLITGLSLVKINALKVFVVIIYTMFALLIFLLHGKVDIVIGLVLSAGNVLGSYLGTRFAISKGDKWIRVILFVAVILMAIKLSGLTDIFLGK